MADIENTASDTLLSGTSGDDKIFNGNGILLNGGSHVTISGGAGNDSVYNSGGDSVTIDAGAGDDKILNDKSARVSIDAGTGNDTIHNYNGTDTTINAGAGNDSICNDGGSRVTIDAGEGSDSINNEGGTEISIAAGAGDDFIDNYGGSLMTILGGKGNDTIQTGGDNVSINGGAGNDSIHNLSGFNVTIDAGTGNDSIYNENGSDSTIDLGAGNDSIDNDGSKVSISGGAGNDTIRTVSSSFDSGTTLTGGDGSDLFIYNPVALEKDDAFNDIITDYAKEDTIRFVEAVKKVSTNSSGSVVFTFAEYYNKLVVKNAADKVVTYIDADGSTKTFGQASTKSKFITLTKGNDTYSNSLEGVTINALGGGDEISNDASNVSIDAGKGNDVINVYSGSNVSVDAGAGSDFIYNEGKKNFLAGGSGSDTIYNGNSSFYTAGGSDVTIVGGAGNDEIENVDGKKVLFVYNAGDGKDSIVGFNATSTLQIAGGSFSTKKSGSNVIVTVGDGKITLVDAASLKTLNIDGTEVETTSWTLDGSTATYGSLVVKGVTSLDGLSLNGKILTVSAASLGTEKISVSDGYTLALGDDVKASTTKKSWTLKNSTASYKQTTTAGYSLDGNKIIYSKKTSKTLATVTGVKSLDGLKVSGKVLTVSASSLGTEKISVSDGYSLALGDDVSSSTTKKSWTLKNSTATYKQITSAGYSLVDNEIIYSKKSSKTLATVKGVNDKSGLKVSGKTIKLSGDALSKKVTVSGDYVFDFASDFKNATITGSSSNDTIIARGKNIFVTGGAGADIFEFKSTGTVSDYEEADKISLSSAANISVSGSDVIFNKKITVAGAAEKIVTYIEGGVEKFFAAPYNEGVTLAANYAEDSFTANATVVTIDASAVLQPLEIFGNKKANVITGSDEDDYIDGGTGADKIFGRDGNDTLIGGKGNDSLSGGKGDDSLWGGAGTDTLRGGDGADIFVYAAGDGKIIVEDFDDAWDKIRVLSGSVDAPESDGKDVTFAVDDGQIIIKGGASKYIPIYLGEGNKNIVQKYIPRS